MNRAEFPPSEATETLSVPDWRKKVYGGSVATEAARRTPPARLKKQLLVEYGNRCAYCRLDFGTDVHRDKRNGGVQITTLRLNWDHLDPYSYVASNPDDNWVPACHICNQLKGASRFDSFQEARVAILARRDRKGWVAT